MERIPYSNQSLIRRAAKAKNEEFKRLKQENIELKKKLELMGKSTSDMKAEFIGEHWIELETTVEDENTGGEFTYNRKITVPWTLQKQIFKEMCEFVKNRKEEDIRP